MDLLDFEGNQLGEWSRELVLTGKASSRLDHLPLDTIFKDAAPNRSLLRVRLMEGDMDLSETLVYFLPPKDLQLPEDPGISLEVVEKEGLYNVYVRAENLAKNVYLQWEDTPGFFSDNFFDVMAGEEIRIVFTPKDKRRKPDTNKLKVISLAQIK